MSGDLNDALLLLEVHRQGSFRRAAAAIGTDQATVSRRMTALEQRVGSPLFVRGRRGVKPTEEGSFLLDAAERSVASMNAFERSVARISDHRKRNVRLAAPVPLVAYVLGPAFARVLPDGHPMSQSAAAVDWDMLPRVSFMALGSPAADIEVAWTTRDSGSSIGMDNVIKRIGTAPFRPLASAEYVKRAGGPNMFGEIHLHPIIEHTDYRDDLNLSRWTEEVDRAEHGPIMTLPCSTAILPLVSGGAGVALLPSFATRIMPGRVEVGTGDMPDLARDLWVSASPESLRMPSVRRVFDAVVRLLSSPPWIRRG